MSSAALPMSVAQPSLPADHAVPAPAASSLADGWPARLALCYARRAGRTLLIRREHSGPLRVQKALYPEGESICHSLLLHPPAGIAGGDRLQLDVALESGAHALITTPGAGKWYRSLGAPALQQVELGLAADAVLEWLPQEAIVFDGALGTARTRVQLAPGARFLGMELWCLGRAARGERYTRGQMEFELRIERAGRPLWRERARLAGADARLQAPAGLGGDSVFGALYAVADGLAPALLEACRGETPCEGRGALTRVPGLIVARYLGREAEAARAWFCALMQHLRPALAGRPFLQPRIWNT